MFYFIQNFLQKYAIVFCPTVDALVISSLLKNRKGVFYTASSDVDQSSCAYQPRLWHNPENLRRAHIESKALFCRTT